MSKRKRVTHNEGADVDMTPMIDVVFQLIIFFIVTIKLNEQINVEFYSSNLYLQMASWCESQGLEGCSEFLKSHATEEMEHMQRLFTYVNECGAMAKLGSIDAPPTEFRKDDSRKQPAILRHAARLLLRNRVGFEIPLGQLLDGLGFAEPLLGLCGVLARDDQTAEANRLLPCRRWRPGSSVPTDRGSA